ncbi:MAG: diguanylate cyclase [Eubacteriales bacterium]
MNENDKLNKEINILKGEIELLKRDLALDISKRKQLNQDLAESQRSNALISSNLLGLVYSCKNDENWTMTYISDGCYDLTGYKPEELIDNPNIAYHELILPEYREALFAKWRSEKDPKAKSRDEYQIRTKQGEAKWVREESQRIVDSEGKTIGSEGFITDITERKLIEEALKLSEGRFRTVFEEAPLGIGLFDIIANKSIQINPKYAEIVGKTPDELLEIDWDTVTHPDDIYKDDEITENLFNERGKAFKYKKRYIKADGSIVWANLTCIGLENADNFQDVELTMIEDVTEQKKREDEILYLNYHDILTKLYNRAFFEEEGRRLDTKRQLPISIIMGDINGLKLINDAFGHQAGDRLLCEIAEVLRSSCRNEDIIARVGGDEFLILLPQTDSEKAQIICERIFEECEKLKGRTDGDVFHPSIAIGTATKVNETQSLDNITKEAESAMYRRKLMDRKSMHSSLIMSIKATMFEKSHETQEHAERMVVLSKLIGRELNLSGELINELDLLATLHDIGKISIDDYILTKTGSLTVDEWVEIKKHPETGYRIAQFSPELMLIADCILSHHERWDGKGYPQGLSGDQIPLLSRIISIVDAYDAMTQDRPYKKAMSNEEGINEIKKNAGTQFDPAIAEIFINQVLPKLNNENL